MRPTRPTALVTAPSALCLLLACTAPGCRPQQVDDPSRATVVEVVDGDTVRLGFGPITESVRLLGIDTPESVHPTLPQQCYGAEATAELERVLPPGTEVEVFRDTDSRDHYGRLLLHLQRADDGFAVNLHMVEQGYAAASFYEPNHHDRHLFAEAERVARTEGRGLWGACEGPDQPLDP